jgi:uncharacterized protein (TIGR02300 family)
MTNPAWGMKHLCQSCGAKYYDLNRAPILCPTCGTVFDPAAGLRLRSDTSYKPGGRSRSPFGKASPLGPVEPDELPVAAEEAEEKPEGDEDGDDPVDVPELDDDPVDIEEEAGVGDRHAE